MADMDYDVDRGKPPELTRSEPVAGAEPVIATGGSRRVQLGQQSVRLASARARQWLCGVLAMAMFLAIAAGIGASAGNGSVVYTYDALGRVLTASYDTGVIVIYTYDANGNRTQQVTNVNSGTAVWNNFNWDAALWG